MFSSLQRLTVASSLLLCATLAFPIPPDGGRHLLKKYELGAAPGGKEYWDDIAFDPGTRRLYVSHKTEVKVVDADSGQIAGSIANLKRVHGTVSELGRGYLSDGGADEVAVFDLNTLQVTGHIKTISGADFAPAAAPTTEQPHPQPHPFRVHSGFWCAPARSAAARKRP